MIIVMIILFLLSLFLYPPIKGLMWAGMYFILIREKKGKISLLDATKIIVSQLSMYCSTDFAVVMTIILGIELLYNIFKDQKKFQR